MHDWSPQAVGEGVAVHRAVGAAERAGCDHHGSTSAGKVVASQGDNREKVLFRDLCEAAQAGSPKTTDLLVRWMSQRHPERTFQSVTDVNRFLDDTELAAEIEQLQQRLFGTPGESATSEPWQGEVDQPVPVGEGENEPVTLVIDTQLVQ